MNLALNKLQKLICHKTQTNKQNKPSEASINTQVDILPGLEI